jgi:hypothetical protein
VKRGNGSAAIGRSGTTRRLTSMTAVAAQVLVAHAARDLEVAVDARHHQDLLELLRALGQGVDAPRLEPRRHDEVTRALGRALDQERRLDFDEAVLLVHRPNRIDEA